ncbi:MAG: hypothetical protein V3T24_02530 [Longimicrobiales bacterium]
MKLDAIDGLDPGISFRDGEDPAVGDDQSCGVRWRLLLAAANGENTSPNSKKDPGEGR